MPQHNRENISLDYAFISLIARKIKVLIVGGGRAGYIKAKSFFQKGYKVSVVSREFDDRFKLMAEEILLIKDEYNVKYIMDKHLVVIASNDESVNKAIQNDCEKHYKIYLNATDSRDGQFITPVAVKTENIEVGVHTNIGSPKTSVFLGSKIKETLCEYDDFVQYISNLRNEILGKTRDRKFNLELMSFVNSDDFYFFYKKNKHELILKLFWRDYFDF